MMTGRLYFKDPWLKEFEALVIRLKEDETGSWISLDQSAFYPEGGGQPFDTGTLTGPLGQYRVCEVQADQEKVVWHRLQAMAGQSLPKPGDRVKGSLDWERRFDHMQQHTGEHILASCVWKITGGFTHGLHIGQEISSIDVTLPGGATRLPDNILDQIEEMANRRVAEDQAIVCRFPLKEELSLLPLRKEPTVSEDVRVCMVGDYEMVACGGTHLERTAQVGLVKITGAEPARGKMRVFFLCGLRAAANYLQTYKALDEAATLLSAKLPEVPGHVRVLLSNCADTRHELAALRRLQTLSQATELLNSACLLPGGGRLIAAQLETRDLPAMEELAGELIKAPGTLILLCATQEDKTLCLFARSKNREEDMRKLLLSCGARGGGKPDFARGASQDSFILERAKARFLTQASESQLPNQKDEARQGD